MSGSGRKEFQTPEDGCSKRKRATADCCKSVREGPCSSVDGDDQGDRRQESADPGVAEQNRAVVEGDGRLTSRASYISGEVVCVATIVWWTGPEKQITGLR